MLTKAEWERKAKKGCIICGCHEIKILEKAHLRAGSKGGTQIEAMCPTHHTKYDKGLCTDTELKKIDITRKTYIRWMPAKKGAEKKANTGNETAIVLDKVQTHLTKQGYAISSKKHGFDVVGVKERLLERNLHVVVGFNNERTVTSEYVLKFKRKVGAYNEKMSDSLMSPHIEGLIAYTGALSKDVSSVVKASKPAIKFKKF